MTASPGLRFCSICFTTLRHFSYCLRWVRYLATLVASSLCSPSFFVYTSEAALSASLSVSICLADVEDSPGERSRSIKLLSSERIRINSSSAAISSEITLLSRSSSFGPSSCMTHWVGFGFDTHRIPFCLISFQKTLGHTGLMSSLASPSTSSSTSFVSSFVFAKISASCFV